EMPPLPRLASIKMLYIKMRSNSHDDLASLLIPWICPNMQLIRVHLTPGIPSVVCVICRHEQRALLPPAQVNARKKQCQRQLFAPIASCSKLHTFLLSNSEVEDLQMDLTQFKI